MKKLICAGTLSLSFILLLGLTACGTPPPVYTAGLPGSATNETPTANKSTNKTPSPGSKTPVAQTPASKTTPAAAAPAATATTPAPAGAAAANQAQLVAQGAAIFSAKCAGCHGAIAQKANDPRVNLKTAAQLTAAKTTKAAVHANTVWPTAAEMPALEAALK